MIALKHLQRQSTQGLYLKNKYNYNSLLGRPVDSITANSLINFNIESIKLFHFDFLLPWSGSIFLVSVGLRLSFELTKYIINVKLNKKIRSIINKFPVKNKEQRFVSSAINEIFLKDLNKDAEFYVTKNKNVFIYISKLFENIQKLQQTEQDEMKQFYSLNTLVSYSINVNRITFHLLFLIIIFKIKQSYLFLSFNRALNHLTQHSHQFEGFAQESIFWMQSIANYDPMFLFPISTILLNYYLLKGSTHPMLIHLRNDPNKFKMFNLSFFPSLFAIFLPANYLIGYIGFITTHLAIRAFKQQLKRKQELKALKKYQLPSDFINKY